MRSRELNAELETALVEHLGDADIDVSQTFNPDDPTPTPPLPPDSVPEPPKESDNLSEKREAG